MNTRELIDRLAQIQAERFELDKEEGKINAALSDSLDGKVATLTIMVELTQTLYGYAVDLLDKEAVHKALDGMLVGYCSSCGDIIANIEFEPVIYSPNALAGWEIEE